MKIIATIQKALSLWPRLEFHARGRLITIGLPQQFAIVACIILLGTSAIWAVTGAELQLANADQLVSAYLFENLQTFHNSVLPGQHTFLLKWPLFWLISALHFAPWAFIAVTVLVVLLTVGGLAYVLFRIERRPVVFGLLCLALASVLALVPPHPQAGVQLPVNMAMITTRNLEYLAYLVVMGLLVTAKRPLIRSPRFWVATGLLAALVATDRLFLTLSVGGAVMLGLVYLCFWHRPMVRFALEWLGMSVLALLGSTGIIWLLTTLQIVHISSGSDSVWGSYGIVTSLQSAVHGVVYALLGVFTNFGANPVFDSMLKEIPAHLGRRLLSAEGFAYVVNLSIVVLAIVASVRVLAEKIPARQTRVRFTAVLVFSSLASMAAFAASDHYYPVDARYEGIVLFAGFVALAAYASFQQKAFFARWAKRAAILLILAVVSACIGGYQLYIQERDAQATITASNAKVTQALAAHNSPVLVGDYWRVFPIKQAMGNRPLTVVPLANCTEPRDMLTSQAWRDMDLKRTSFAYLLTTDRPDPQFPECSLEQVTRAYGRPNASVIVSGTLAKPTATLLYYDYGANRVPLSATPTDKELSTVAPIDIDQLNKIAPPSASCNGKLIMNMVAHQDDDLLFMNPDIIHELRQGSCIRTVYLTAGDGGQGELYWLGRQTGAERAYNTMLNSQAVWTHTIVRLADKQFITLANPIGHPNVGLIFMNLPDGNLNGSGFNATNSESIHKLASGGIDKIHSVDNQSEYTADQLIDALTVILRRYQPVKLQAQTRHNTNQTFSDHSDHLAVGYFAEKVIDRYGQNGGTLDAKFYEGYPIRARRENVSGDDMEQKAAAFFSYATSDSSVCESMQVCAKDTAYIFYLRRQYQSE